jgi:hypothetical protein
MQAPRYWRSRSNRPDMLFMSSLPPPTWSTFRAFLYCTLHPPIAGYRFPLFLYNISRGVLLTLQKILHRIHKIRPSRVSHLVRRRRYCRRLSSIVTFRVPRVPRARLRLTALMASLVAPRNFEAIFSLPFALGCSPSSVSCTAS